MSDHTRGLVLGFSAWAIWGFFPLYWPLLEPSSAVEILAHRVVWSMVVMSLVVVLVRRGDRLRRVLADARARRLLAVAAVLIATNWGVYIYGVNSGNVVETSLGYFINPLVSVLLGVLLLGERMRRAQWAAIGLAAAAVLGLTVEYGRPPWIALALAFSFAFYGLTKKKARTGAVEGLVVETVLVAPLALGYLAFLGSTGAATFGRDGALHALLLVGTGLVTVVPLLCFGAAATRIPLSTLGLMQYLTPTLQFALGVLVFSEPMPPTRLAGFALIWAALVVFTVDSLRHRRRQLRLTAESAAL